MRKNVPNSLKISRVNQQNQKLMRLRVFKSNCHIYAEIIDDLKHETLFSANSLKQSESNSLSQNAENIGNAIAAMCKKSKISAVVFDRGRYQYHGVIKILADSAREAGLKF